MMNTQINTLKSNRFQYEQKLPPGKRDMQTAFARFYPSLKRAGKKVWEIASINAGKVANNKPGAKLLRFICQNMLVKFLLDNVLLMSSLINALSGRFAVKMTGLLMKTTEAFFKFMDDFFLMDEEIELIGVSVEGGKVEGFGNFRYSPIRKMAAMKKSPVSFFRASDFVYPNQPIKTENQKRISKVKSFQDFLKINISPKQYCRFFIGRTPTWTSQNQKGNYFFLHVSCFGLSKLQNLFKPFLPKLPFNLNFIAHQTPV